MKIYQVQCTDLWNHELYSVFYSSKEEADKYVAAQGPTEEQLLEYKKMSRKIDDMNITCDDYEWNDDNDRCPGCPAGELCAAQSKMFNEYFEEQEDILYYVSEITVKEKYEKAD